MESSAGRPPADGWDDGSLETVDMIDSSSSFVFSRRAASTKIVLSGHVSRQTSDVVL